MVQLSVNLDKRLNIENLLICCRFFYNEINKSLMISEKFEKLGYIKKRCMSSRSIKYFCNLPGIQEYSSRIHVVLSLLRSNYNVNIIASKQLFWTSFCIKVKKKKKLKRSRNNLIFFFFDRKKNRLINSVSPFLNSGKFKFQFSLLSTRLETPYIGWDSAVPTFTSDFPQNSIKWNYLQPNEILTNKSK